MCEISQEWRERLATEDQAIQDSYAACPLTFDILTWEPMAYDAWTWVVLRPRVDQRDPLASALFAFAFHVSGHCIGPGTPLYPLWSMEQVARRRADYARVCGL